jgi:fluoride exporter
MERLVWVCLGGALGTGARYLLGMWAGRALGTTFPYGTLLVNVSGCFLIALVMQIGLSTTLIPPTLRLALTTGVMGGLTTYSSFNYETSKLIEERAFAEAAANVGGTLLGCFAAGLLGVLLARRLVGS